MANNGNHSHEGSPKVKSEFDLELTFGLAEGLRVSSEIAWSSPPRKYFLFRSSEPKMRPKILEPDGMATVTLREPLRFRPQFGSQAARRLRAVTGWQRLGRGGTRGFDARRAPVGERRAHGRTRSPLERGDGGPVPTVPRALAPDSLITS